MLRAPGLVGGRYRADHLLAASGMGDVYAARDLRLDRPVALKFLRAEGPTDAARFRREMTTLAQLEHPGLVRLYDADVHDTTPYLVLELVDGPSLSAHLAEDGPLDADETARLLADLAGALTYVHERGIVHRDVKPSNVLLDPEHGARLTDFGIARAADATAMTGTAMTIGTAAYLAPEQARGEAVTTAADVYSLGLVLLECRTGARAFPGAPVEAAVARLSRDPDVPSTLEPEWRALLVAMTARDPSARPRASELVGVLSAARADGTATVATAAPTAPMPATPPAAATDTAPVAPAVAPVRPARTMRRPSRRVIVAATVAALLLVASLGVALADRSLDAPGGGAARAQATTAPSAPTTTPTTVATTVPPTTLPPTTTPPVAVVAAPDCAGLEAQKQAIDEQRKGVKGDKGDKGAERAFDDRKKAVDEQLKACRGR